MALIQCDFFSETLGIWSSMNVILPQAPMNQSSLPQKIHDKKYPVLYLLHGLSDDHTIWLRQTSIERYVAPLGLAVVMPAINRSFYTDMVKGGRYWSFVSDELPAIVKSLFPISGQREDTYVTGLSMGGYGAFKLGLLRPELFAAAASLSGVLDVSIFGERNLLFPDEYSYIFGSAVDVVGSDNDLFHLADALAAMEGPKPRLFQCCGTDDFLYEENVRFFQHCRSKGFDYTYEEEPGNHEWSYWDKKIQRVLEWLPISVHR